MVLKNPLLDFNNFFWFGFPWVHSNARRQSWKGLFLLGFNLVNKKTVWRVDLFNIFCIVTNQPWQRCFSNLTELIWKIFKVCTMYFFIILVNGKKYFSTEWLRETVLRGKGTIQPGLRLLPSGNFFLALNRSHHFLLKKVRI